MSKINDEGFLELSGVNKNAMLYELSGEKFPLLTGLSPLSLRVLNQSSRTLNVGAGVEMMHAGDTPHDLYFIAKGGIAIAKEFGGTQKIIAQLNAGDFYGEYGALRGKTRFASAFTAEKSTIIRVDLHAVQQVMDADEEFKKRISVVMKERLLSSFLFSHPTFHALDQTARARLSKQLKVIEVKRDEELFALGDAADAYYMVLSGEAEVSIGAGADEIMLEVRRDNDTLGEVRSDKGAKYAYSVRTANNLDVLLLDKAAMQLLNQESPQVIAHLNQFMASQMKKTIMLMQKSSQA